MGAGRYVADIAIEQAAKSGHRVMVCVSSDTDENWRTDPKLASELEEQGVHVQVIGDFFHRRPDLLSQSATQLRELLKEFAGSKILVNAHSAMAAAVGHWAHCDGLVITCHGWSAGRAPEIDLQDALAYQLCDAVTTFSSHWIDRLINDMAAPNPQLIPMGLNLKRFPKLPEKNIAEPAPLRIVTVCEQIKRKGVDLLINAMPAIWNQFPDAELHIIGHGESIGDFRLLAEKTDLGMRRITFHGTLANPYKIIGEFDLFVLASRSDNLPIALVEALLARLPIVATAVGGTPELLSAVDGSIIVAPESHPALSEGILRIATQGRDYLHAIGLKGEQFARSELNIRKTAAKLKLLYKQALRTRSR